MTVSKHSLVTAVTALTALTVVAAVTVVTAVTLINSPEALSIKKIDVSTIRDSILEKKSSETMLFLKNTSYA